MPKLSDFGIPAAQLTVGGEVEGVSVVDEELKREVAMPELSDGVEPGEMDVLGRVPLADVLMYVMNVDGMLDVTFPSIKTQKGH